MDEDDWLDSLLTAPDRPYPVGGLATPLGVYMHSGHLRAGAGDLGLVLTGVAMSVMWWLIVVGLDLLFDWLGITIPGLLIFPVVTLAFLVALRATPLAGYHAAEHQTIAALEAGLPLAPATVSRMPRVHPRCGSNILAMAILLECLHSVLPPQLQRTPLQLWLCWLAIGILTFLWWRPLARLLQHLFTTRTPSERQLRNGIAAGEELLRRYRERRDYRAPWWRRFWNVGLLQLMAGGLLPLGLLQLLGLW